MARERIRGIGGFGTIDPTRGRTAINLYGTPGTGKTFAAEAIAHRLKKKILKVNYAELESKFVGDTAKNIVEIFRQARAQDAVLFFDESDSILGKRLTQVRHSTDHAVNVSRSVMLLQLDEFEGVTIFATNLARNYDSAFVRRIIAHIFMPLPGDEERRRLWTSHIPAQLPVELTEDDWLLLTQKSEGLSGGDILNAVIYAASRALAQDATHCKVVLEDFLLAVETELKGKTAVEKLGRV